MNGNAKLKYNVSHTLTRLNKENYNVVFRFLFTVSVISVKVVWMAKLLHLSTKTSILNVMDFFFAHTTVAVWLALLRGRQNWQLSREQVWWLKHDLSIYKSQACTVLMNVTWQANIIKNYPLKILRTLRILLRTWLCDLNETAKPCGVYWHGSRQIYLNGTQNLSLIYFSSNKW